MHILIELHPAISFTLVATVTVVLSLFVTRFVRRRLPDKWLEGNQESVVIFFNAFELVCRAGSVCCLRNVDFVR